MKQEAKRFLAKIAPRAARFTYETINTLNGSRFREFKTHNEHQIRSEAHQVFIAEDSMRRLYSAEQHDTPIAVISPLPPEETGLSQFTLSAFQACSSRVDIFSKIYDIPSYISLLQRSADMDHKINFYSIEILPAARAIRKYLAQIYQVGNSPHNVSILDSIMQLKVFPTNTKTFVHIHDPCLLYLLKEYSNYKNRDFAGILSASYKLDIGSDIFKITHGDFSTLTQRGVIGPQAIFKDIDLAGIITNSIAAKKLIENDWPTFPPDRIHALFHPVFSIVKTPVYNVSPTTKKRIGMFGIQSDSKRSGVVVSAYNALIRQIPDLELVIAGFNAAQFAKVSGLMGNKNIIVEDAPSDMRLIEIMRSCSLAIQLRKENLGENSGIIPQLMSVGVPVITSSVGAFLEYGDAVSYLDSDDGPEKLAKLINEELSDLSKRNMQMQNYVESHTAAKFCHLLHKIAIMVPSKNERLSA